MKSSLQLPMPAPARRPSFRLAARPVRPPPGAARAPDDTRSCGDPEAETAPAVKWDDWQMKTSYANVVNAASTREEVTLFFGTNQTWNPAAASEFEVKLSDRIVLSPFAAKRLWMLMGAVLREHEKRFGALDLGAATTPGAAAAVDKDGNSSAKK